VFLAFFCLHNQRVLTADPLSDAGLRSNEVVSKFDVLVTHAQILSSMTEPEDRLHLQKPVWQAAIYVDGVTQAQQRCIRGAMDSNIVAGLRVYQRVFFGHMPLAAMTPALRRPVAWFLGMGHAIAGDSSPQRSPLRIATPPASAAQKQLQPSRQNSNGLAASQSTLHANGSDAAGTMAPLDDCRMAAEVPSAACAADSKALDAVGESSLTVAFVKSSLGLREEVVPGATVGGGKEDRKDNVGNGMHDRDVWEIMPDGGEAKNHPNIFEVFTIDSD